MCCLPNAVGHAHGRRAPVGDGSELLFLSPSAHDADLGDLVVLGDDQCPNALLSDVGKHFVLQAAFEGVADFELLRFLVERALDDFHVLGSGQGLRVSFLTLTFHLGKRNLVAFDLGDDSPKFVGKHDADGENQD